MQTYSDKVCVVYCKCTYICVWHACNHYERSTTVPSIQGTDGSPGFRGIPGSAGFPVSSLQHVLV